MEHPTGRYGKFVQKLEAARNRSKIRFVNFLANNPDWKARWKLMKNYWPEEFNERIITQLSGPDGGPIEMETKRDHEIVFTCSDSEGLKRLIEEMSNFPVVDGKTGAPLVDANGNPITWKNVYAARANGRNGNGA
jgi:hypothetical protein